MKVETILSLTNEVKEALYELQNIDCSNIDSCNDCPFKDKKSNGCLAIGIQNNIHTVLKNLEGG